MAKQSFSVVTDAATTVNDRWPAVILSAALKYLRLPENCQYDQTFLE